MIITDEIYFTHDSNMTEAEVGTKAQFVCSVAGAVGDVIFTWYEKALELNNNSKYIINSSVSVLYYIPITVCACVCIFVCVCVFVLHIIP